MNYSLKVAHFSFVKKIYFFFDIFRINSISFIRNKAHRTDVTNLFNNLKLPASRLLVEENVIPGIPRTYKLKGLNYATYKSDINDKW